MSHLSSIGIVVCASLYCEHVALVLPMVGAYGVVVILELAHSGSRPMPNLSVVGIVGHDNLYCEHVERLLRL